MIEAIAARMRAHKRKLVEGFEVRRVLPSAARRAVGPFVFLDHMGPVTMPSGRGLDVAPHPHVGLATVTYLWRGRIEHRDSLGHVQTIEPGAVNWMTAGRGIVHSERSRAEDRATEQALHGLQLWAALPRELEQAEPAFEHVDAGELPLLDRDGARARLVAGTAWGEHAPVRHAKNLFFVDAWLPAGGSLDMPPEYAQRAFYVVAGEVDVAGGSFGVGELGVFMPGADIVLQARNDAHVVLLGGAPLDGPRFMSWNFVASSEELLAQAREDWQQQRFRMVPGDPEFIPLPERHLSTLRIEPS